MREISSLPAIDLNRLAPSLGSTCSGYLGSYRGRFEQAVRDGEPGVASSRAYCRVLDGLLGALYCASDAAARDAGRGSRGRLALVAVGGYGRGVVGLRSDVDVLFLCDDPSDPHVGALAEGLLYPLWDLGVDIGHAVRGVAETLRLARDDLATTTSLLDLRRVAGDASIVTDLEQAARRDLFEEGLTDFLASLERERGARHERFGDTLFLLEPDVKQGRGGLRDLDVAEWAARARWGVRTTEEFVRCGALLAREVDELEAAREFLWRVRNLLHLRAGRQQDRLTFGDQEDIAVDLGFVDGVTLAVEHFMQTYYRHARMVAQTAERMLQRARPAREEPRSTMVDLGDGTMLLGRFVALERPERLETDPALAIRFYRQVVRHDRRPHPAARDAIARIAVDPGWRYRLRSSEEATQLFLWLLTHVADTPVPQGSILTELHEVGLLVAMIHEFEPLCGRVHHDVYHIYTVDVHSIRSVDALRAFAQGVHPEGLGLAARLMADAPRPVPLYLGVLLHAVGKVFGRDGAARGVEIARTVADRLGLSPADADHVAWLVQEHRSLYYWATQRDIHDPETVSEVMRIVGSTDRLGDLFLVTVASLSTINPKAMTSWKARMLEDLYFKMVNQFEGRGGGARSERLEAIRSEVTTSFADLPGAEQLDAFVASMPERYLLAHGAETILRHAEIARDRGDRELVVEISAGPDEDLHELVVLTADRPGLLADVAAVLTAQRLAIVSAEVYTRSDTNEAFDVFLVRRSERADRQPLSRAHRDRIRADLADRLAGEVSADALLSRHRGAPAWAVRPTPEVPTEVTVDNEASLHHTIVDVFTRDRPGLLHVIARTLHEQGLSIASCKVNTEGERVADVFYVRDAHDGKLRQAARLAGLQEALLDRLREFHSAATGGAQ